MIATRIISLRNRLSFVLGVALLGSLAVLTPRGLAQPVPSQPAFEVAEIKLSRPGSPMSGDFHQAGHLHLTGIPLRYLIAAAWQMKEYAIVGGPAWLNSDRFDVAANSRPGECPRRRQGRPKVSGSDR
jgi:hypothetical protein